MTDATPRATCDEHSHHRAGCPRCQARSAERGRIRHRLITYGRWRGNVDAAPARAHLLTLHKRHGMSRRAISAQAGIARSVVDRLLSDNPQTYLLARTHDALIAVQPAAGPGRYVDSLGAARRIQALTALGHPLEYLADQLGIGIPAVARLRRQHAPAIGLRRHRAVAALYDRLQGTPGPCAKTRAYARAVGYLPPLAWEEDESIDDPGARAHPVAADVADRALAGELTAVELSQDERLAVVSVLTGWRWTDRRIAEHLHWAGGRRSVAAYRRRHGIEPGATRGKPAPEVRRIAPKVVQPELRGVALDLAIARHDRPGLTVQQVADVVGCSTRAVHRRRQARAAAAERVAA
jgi:hypothetical protein